MICHWPKGISDPGTLRHTPGHLPDIMRTILDITGASYPQKFNGHQIPAPEGHSLKTVFDDDQMPERPIFWEHEGNAAIRCGQWKLVREYPGDWELYDMVADRTELNNLAKNHREMVNSYSQQYDEWAKRCGVIPRDKILEMMKELPMSAFWEDDD